MRDRQLRCRILTRRHLLSGQSAISPASRSLMRLSACARRGVNIGGMAPSINWRGDFGRRVVDASSCEALWSGVRRALFIRGHTAPRHTCLSSSRRHPGLARAETPNRDFHVLIGFGCRMAERGCDRFALLAPSLVWAFRRRASCHAGFAPCAARRCACALAVDARIVVRRSGASSRR